MESIQQIKNRIDSIIGTRQITQSMRLVSTVRLRAARDRMVANETFNRETARLVQEAAREPDAFDHPYVRGGMGGNATALPKCVIVVGSDRGLCGGYNINVCKEAGALMRALGQFKLITVGQKIRDYFAQPGRNMGTNETIKSFTGISETPFFEDAEEIANTALALFNGGEVDEIFLIHTRFINMLTLVPARTLLLPFGKQSQALPSDGADRGSDNPDRVSGMRALTNYEPGCAAFLSHSVPFYMAAVIFGSILESSVCEQCSRTMSMDTAVKNADEMIETLTLRYNKERQNAITTELADIIGGMRALELKLGRGVASGKGGP
ncbi:MAG: ATP synthase F1 subunit gamma [Oscillospiraceae bacterium]|nr:ATP synthase F1 subunit gamma [Oscillospiraceae bacterium]